MSRTLAYYNEIDEAAAHVLRHLIEAGVIAPGEVDTRSIKDVPPDDLKGFTQCHFFAGGGLWSVAARLAGWPDERPLWTGSCPCQPFSVAGNGAGADDPRHLWPDFFRLIRATRPALVVGEQVAGAAGYGWFDGVAADLEGEGFAARTVDIPACAVDAPHIRQRLYWCAVANSSGAPRQQDAGSASCDETAHGRAGRNARQPNSNYRPYCDDEGAVAEPDSGGQARGGVFRPRESCGADQERPHGQSGGSDRSICGTLEHGASIGRAEGRSEPEFRGGRGAAAHPDAQIALGDGLGARLEGHAGHGDASRGSHEARPTAAPDGRNGTHWSDAEWIMCHDGKARRAKSGICLLVDGLPGRVDLWRIGGNAIVPQVAAEVIGALMDVLPEVE